MLRPAVSGQRRLIVDLRGVWVSEVRGPEDLGDRVLRQVVLGLGKLQHGDETPGVISPEAISCCSPVDGPARPEYFRPVALWNAGATIFSFRYKRETA